MDPGGDLRLWVPGAGTNTFLQASRPQSQGRHSHPALCLGFPGPQHCAAHCFASSPPGFALLRCFTVPISWVRNKVLEFWGWILFQVLEKKAQQCLSFFLYLVLSLFIKNCYYNMQYAYGAICIWCICIYAICIWWLTYKVKPNRNSVDHTHKSAVLGECHVPLLSWESGKLAFEWKHLSKTSTSDWKLMPFVSLPPAQLWIQNEFLLLRLSWLSLCPGCVKPATGHQSNTLISSLMSPLNGRIYCCLANINLRSRELDQWRQNCFSSIV